MHADVQEADREQELVLLERARVQLLAHRQEQVAVQVAHVVDRRLGLFKVHESDLVVQSRRVGVGDDRNDFKDVDLAGVLACVRRRSPIFEEDARETHAALDGQVFCAGDGRADSDKVAKARSGTLGFEADRLERRDEFVLAELVAVGGGGGVSAGFKVSFVLAWSRVSATHPCMASQEPGTRSSRVER